MLADTAGEAPATRRERWAVVAFVGLLTLPFLGKSFHIDDTFFLRVTENIVADPLDPYGGTFDWWNRPQPLLSLDSNPPLLNYWLAPFAALSDYSEVVLHAAMLPFPLLLAFSVFWLARRFTAHPWWALAFGLTSAAVVVSGNVMRDLPAAALGAAAIALMIAGTDADDRRWLAAGSAVAGLAILTKYSAWIALALIMAYPILKRKPRYCAWGALTLAIFAAWCLHNLWAYGESHFFGQLGRGYTSPGHGWRDNLSGLPVVAGSLLYLLPALVARLSATRDAVAGVGAALAALTTWWAVQTYTQGGADGQYLFWATTGCGLLFLCFLSGVRGAAALVRDRRDPGGVDALFLLLWLAGPLLLSVVFVPFQAVRHLLPALPPLVFLGIRALERQGGLDAAWTRAVLGVSLVVQAGVALAVARADAEYADSYRDFAGRAPALIAGLAASDGEGDRIWYLGHWGWMFYANRAGFEKLHTTGPYPKAGDFLIVPVYVDKGKVLTRMPRVAERMQQVERVVYPGSIPIRTMHPAGAGFYAMFSQPRRGNPPPVPYRFMSGTPLEIFDIHRLRGAKRSAGGISRGETRDGHHLR